LFSDDLKARILAGRKKSSDQIDLTKFYAADEAKSLGLIDRIGRIYTIVPQILPNAQITRMHES
jgi:ClpP class serine protease